MLRKLPNILATGFVTIFTLLYCFASSSFGSLILQKQEHFSILDKARVIDPHGDSDQIIKDVPSIQLLANTRYRITIASQKPVFILVSRKSRVPKITSWVRVTEPYVYPDTKEFFINSADLPGSNLILLTVWEGPVNLKKGGTGAIPVTFNDIKVTRNKVKFSLPYTLEYAYKGGVVKLTIFREK